MEEEENKMVDLTGKWALVTGASRGIGRVTSLTLAKQGCNLALHSRKAESLKTLGEEAEKCGVKVFLAEQDFREQGAADALLRKIEAQGIAIDILINNAGINLSIDREMEGRALSIEEWTQEECEATVRVNVAVPLLLSGRLAVGMRRRGFGRIINLTSDIHGSGDHLAYSVSKGAVDKLTGDLAEILEGSGVSVSAVEPGWCQTFLGGMGAVHLPENVSPGILVPVCMEKGANKRVFHAQDYAGMTVREAVARAESESGKPAW